MEIFSQLFTGTALIAGFTYLGYQLKGIPNLVWQQIKKRLVYTVHIEETSELFIYFENWLKKYHESSFKNVRACLNYEKGISEENDAFIPTEKNKLLSQKSDSLKLQHHSDIFTFKYKSKQLLINKGREKFTNVSNIRSAFFSNFRIEGWLAKQEITELLNEVIEYNRSIKINVLNTYTNDNYGYWLKFGEILGKSIENIVLREKKLILDDINDFISKEEWYNKRSLSYKRGYLFHGTPGNGKTSLCFALAKYLNKDISFLNLNDLEKDSNLFAAFSNIRDNTILVLEDVDAIFGTREGKSPISFSSLLNCLDGAFSRYGIITIMTTNHFEKIDKALIREGRIDLTMEISCPDKEMIEEYLNIFYDKKVELLSYDNDYSMSKIQELCLQNKNDLEKLKNILIDE